MPMARIQTAEKTFLFDLSEDGEATPIRIKYLDIGQIHSLCNRFSARQGFEYVVQSLEIGAKSGGSFTAAIYRLPESWPCINAWEKAMILWRKQQDDAADEAGLESTRARYRDFKIHFDTGHVTAGFGANLIPNGFVLDDPAVTTDVYDWEPSQIVVPNDTTVGNTTERLLHMVGGDNGVAPTMTSAGLIKAYAESRSRPQQTDPNIVDVSTGGLFGEMFDVGDSDEDVIDNLQESNNQPPYLMGRSSALEYYPGAGYQGVGPIDASNNQHPGQLVDILSIGASQNFNSDSCGGFVAPCGLLKIEYRAAGVAPASPATLNYEPSFWLKLVLAPGDYKGVLAQSMQEAN